MLMEFLQQAAQSQEGAVPGAHSGRSHGMVHVMAALGPFGVFLISIVDASFIPLPIPGFTDILVVILAARHENWVLLALAATTGSIIGGYLSYRVGAAGGMHLLEKRVPKKYFKQLCKWVENHTMAAVALPAFMPPPTPTSIFILAAGALKVPRRKFLTAYSIARAVRYSIGAWVGYVYGRRVLHEWNQFSDAWGNKIEIVLWVLIGGAMLYAGWYLWRHVKNERHRPKNESTWKELAEE